MRKSILILVIAGAFFAGTLLAPQYAAADHIADFANLGNVVLQLINGMVDVFTQLANQITAVEGDVATNTAAISGISSGVHVDDVTGDICLGLSPPCPP